MDENLKLEEFKELAVLFTLSDENFKIASEAVLTNIKNLLKDKSYLKEIKDELSRSNLTVNDYLENMEKSIESIDESLNDENISSDKIDFFKKITYNNNVKRKEKIYKYKKLGLLKTNSPHKKKNLINI